MVAQKILRNIKARLALVLSRSPAKQFPLKNFLPHSAKSSHSSRVSAFNKLQPARFLVYAMTTWHKIYCFNWFETGAYYEW